MVFNSLTFLVFFATLVLLSRLPMRWGARKGVLLCANCLFYASYHPAYILLFFALAVLDWSLALFIDRIERPSRRKLFLIISVAVNIGLLAFFKYVNFFMENVDALLGALNISWETRRIDILLPVGISFYIFQSLSYIIDVYRRRIAADRSFLDFAFFVSFFPHLVAGPIVRARDFLPQLKEERTATPLQFYWGLCLLTWGLFQKIALADALLAPIVDKVFGAAAGTRFSFPDAWIGTLAFAGQILFDFAGYTTCAIGTALCFGFVLTDNFRCPYAARGFSDFWQRWHISLSQWLRDYLYISLGGNRAGQWRTYLNILITMLLGGFWHGASWNFIIWGLLHGIYLIVERLASWIWGEARWAGWLIVRLGVQLLTFYLVCISWVFFRAQNLPAAAGLIKSMTVGAFRAARPGRLQDGETMAVLVLIGLLLLGHHFLRNRSIEYVFARLPWWARSVALAALIIGILQLQGAARGFIYFQF